MVSCSLKNASAVGYNLYEAKKVMRERTLLWLHDGEQGEADAMISGLTRKYPDTIRPALEIIGMAGRCAQGGRHVYHADQEGAAVLCGYDTELQPYRG